jgi:hypothetical protein
MANASETTAHGKHTRNKKKDDDPACVENKRVSDGLLDITALIRSVQRGEGNPDCFDRNEGSCEKLECSWRSYCLEGFPTPE